MAARIPNQGILINGIVLQEARRSSESVAPELGVYPRGLTKAGP